MTRTPPALSLIGISLTVVAIAAGGWLSEPTSLQSTRDVSSEPWADVQESWIDASNDMAPAGEAPRIEIKEANC